MAKSDASIFDASTTTSIVNELGKLAQAIEETRKKILKIIPAKYGSDLWWEKSMEEGIESIKAGKGKKFETYEEAVKYLNS